MNLLSLLLKVMMSNNSLNSISGKTGISSSTLKKLLPIMIPLLLKYMTSNASSGNGATSLLGALSQHTNKKSMDEQLRESDEVDGGKIIGHILGSSQADVTKDLASQSGLSADQISQLFAVIAPALMSGVSEAASDASISSGAAAPTFTAPVGQSIFGSLLGLGNEAPAPAAEENLIPFPAAKDENPAAYNGTSLLQMLLGAMQ